MRRTVLAVALVLVACNDGGTDPVALQPPVAESKLDDAACALQDMADLAAGFSRLLEQQRALAVRRQTEPEYHEFAPYFIGLAAGYKDSRVGMEYVRAQIQARADLFLGKHSDCPRPLLER